jgi:CelD/BcsL family acetyltransferase involved in cellulose biosynthesis
VTPDGLTCTVVAGPAAAQRVRADWEALLRRAARSELTHAPHWLLTWWQVYGRRQGRRLRLVLLHQGGRLVGVAPLLLRTHWYGCLPFRRVEFLASGEPPAQAVWSNHLGVVAQRGAEGPVVRRLAAALLAGELGGWDEVVLPMLSGDTPFPALLRDAFAAGGPGVAAEVVETARAPYAVLPARWEDYVRGLPRAHRRHLVRTLSAFDAWAGPDSRLLRATTPAELEEGKRVLVELHHERWRGAGKAGVFRRPDYVRFHDAIMPQLLARGELELLWLTARGRPVAALYGMAWGDKVCAYQMGRRLDVPANVRPGGVLLALAIRKAIEAGRREFDFLADEAPYKRWLAHASRPLLRLRVVRRSLREGCRRAGTAARRRLGALRRAAGAG